MNSATRTREVLTVTVDGCRLRGTHHFPQGALQEQSQIGLLMVNPGFQPRAAQGDSGVYWADEFAKCGYPVFRMDLPGLGDSEGIVPEPMLDYVNAGGYAQTVSAIVDEIAERYQLAGMVTMGLCAGAVTALYGAAVSRKCVGAVLLDPYFYQTHDERPRLRSEISRWTMWSRIGAVASAIYDRIRYVRLLSRGNQPPSNANWPLINCWTRLASSGAPILALKSPAFKARGVKPRVGEFDYFGYLQGLTGRDSKVVVTFVEGTNHSFADTLGRAAVREHTLRWLGANFPCMEREPAIVVNGVH